MLYQYHQMRFFNANAYALRKAGFDGIAACDCLDAFYQLWPEHKQTILEEDFDTWKNPDLPYWNEYVHRYHLEEDPEMKRCLQKIERDYES